MENHYNLIWREDERELRPFCVANGIGMIPYSPMARGFLCGHDRSTERSESDDYSKKLYGRASDHAVLEAVAALASRRGLTPAQVALAWILHQPGISAPIIGATHPEHVDAAIAALEIELAPLEQRMLEAPYVPRAPR